MTELEITEDHMIDAREFTPIGRRFWNDITDLMKAMKS